MVISSEHNILVLPEEEATHKLDFIYRNIRIFFWMGLFGVLQYLVCTTILMGIYPGGHFFDHYTVGYSFSENFLSDLGRTRNFGRLVSPTAPWYRLTLSVAGLTTMGFVTGIFLYFRRTQPFLAGFAWLTGMVAGFGYVGIANNPVNEHYFIHVSFVQWGFLAFLAMSMAIAGLLYREKHFDNIHAFVTWIFVIILLIQVTVMILGPRSWSSYEAMRLQVILQKIVVYAEMAAMVYLCVLFVRKCRTLPEY